MFDSLNRILLLNDTFVDNFTIGVSNEYTSPNYRYFDVYHPKVELRLVVMQTAYLMIKLCTLALSRGTLNYTIECLSEFFLFPSFFSCVFGS